PTQDERRDVGHRARAEGPSAGGGFPQGGVWGPGTVGGAPPHFPRPTIFISSDLCRTALATARPPAPRKKKNKNPRPSIGSRRTSCARPCRTAPCLLPDACCGAQREFAHACLILLRRT